MGLLLSDAWNNWRVKLSRCQSRSCWLVYNVLHHLVRAGLLRLCYTCELCSSVAPPGTTRATNLPDGPKGAPPPDLFTVMHAAAHARYWFHAKLFVKVRYEQFHGLLSWCEDAVQVLLQYWWWTNSFIARLDTYFSFSKHEWIKQ